MKFTKMEGLGNDYIYINCFQERVEHPRELAVRFSDRHFGIGADGIILIKPSEIADFCMDMYNADGSQAEMCGNGIRCVGKYVYDYGLTDKEQISVETLAGIKYLDLTVEKGKVTLVTVDMGMPILQAAEIPVVSDREQVVDAPIVINDCEYRMTCVSMGNPHCVIFTSGVDGLDLEKTGSAFENHPLFPEKVNTEFCEILSDGTIKMRVWERGSGETWACGTGACAAAVAAVTTGRAKWPLTVRLIGGNLHIDRDPSTGHILMTGPAVTVYSGAYYPGC